VTAAARLAEPEDAPDRELASVEAPALVVAEVVLCEAEASRLAVVEVVAREADAWEPPASSGAETPEEQAVTVTVAMSR
jgi:hypothetical protein